MRWTGSIRIDNQGEEEGSEGGFGQEHFATEVGHHEELFSNWF